MVLFQLVIKPCEILIRFLKVNFSFLVIFIGILFLAVPTFQRGNLYADTIYSSEGDLITIDTLEGGNSEITNANAGKRFFFIVKIGGKNLITLANRYCFIWKF